MADVVLYHANCQDGWISAYIAAKARDMHNYQLIPASYDNYEDAVFKATAIASKSDTVYILDFRLPVDALIGLYKQVYSVVLLDHHATAEEMLSEFILEGTETDTQVSTLEAKYACSGIPYVEFDKSECGATMTCKFFGVADPRLIHLAAYAKDRDLWQWKLPDSRAVSEYLSTLENRVEVWDAVAVNRSCILSGQTLLSAKTKRIARVIEHAWPCRTQQDTVLWYKGMAVNATNDQSEVCEQMLQANAFAMTYREQVDGSINVSIRSNGGQAKIIAEYYGGGGHPNAAGCTFGSYRQFISEFIREEE